MGLGLGLQHSWNTSPYETGLCHCASVQFTLTLILVSTPTVDAPDEQTEELYDTLGGIVAWTPIHYVVMFNRD